MDGMEGEGDARGGGGPLLSAEDQQLLEALRRGDEAAFARLVTSYQSALTRLALTFVGERSVAEEVVQDTWVAVLQGLDRFAGRSSLKTWIFRILMNRARTRGAREGRSVPFADLAATEDAGAPSIDPSAFWPPDHPQRPGAWVSYPRPWSRTPESSALDGELQRVIRDAVDALPPAQRTVLTLRDIAGWDSDEVCNELAITETNQRVLLHRGRAKVRAAVARYQQDA
jgi:RNA polymerase sigma-70 factor, ECF subfamily